MILYIFFYFSELATISCAHLCLDTKFLKTIYNFFIVKEFKYIQNKMNRIMNPHKPITQLKQLLTFCYIICTSTYSSFLPHNYYLFTVFNVIYI